MNIKLFVFIFVILVISSVSAVSATDNETSQDAMTQIMGTKVDGITEDITQTNVNNMEGINKNDLLSQVNESDVDEISDGNIKLKNIEDKEIICQDNGCRVIYVGQNKTTDGGSGTSENPFNSFELACNNLTGENNVEINVCNGTYYLNSDLKFNTSNLFITGMGNVVIRNLENRDGAYASFGLTSSSGNFTFSNIIFDGSHCTYNLNNLVLTKYFYVFKGNANLGILNNCTITGFNSNVMFSNQFNRRFIGCNFADTYNHISISRWYDGLMIDFEYCIISNGIYIGMQGDGRLNITYNNVWFGSNRIDEYLYYPALTGGYYTTAKSNLIRYAIFSASENYLGNNTYEIAGKLIWNDSTSDGIELLGPMNVKFSSKTGDVVRTTVLENGTFSVIYKSRFEDNCVEVELDSQEVILEFMNVIHVVANPIYQGGEQTITIKLPQAVYSIVNITVNDKTYEIPSNGSSTFNFTVPDELFAGNYQVNASINDAKDHVYGFYSTNWTISQINQNMVVTTPANVNIADEFVILTVLLENDETGNVSVFCSNKNITMECFGGNLEIDISSILSAGDNDIKVVYSGNKRYLAQTKSYKIFVNKAYPNMNITKPFNPIIGDEMNIIISLPVNTSGSLTVFVGDKNFTITNISDKNIVDISDFVVIGNNQVSVKYSGDDWWDSQIKKETIYVNKITPQMTIELNQDTILIGENVTMQIHLPGDASGILIVNGKYSFNVSGEITNISIPCLTAGANVVNVSYCGDGRFNPIIENVEFKVLKPVLKASNINMLYTSGAKYQVKVTFNGNPIVGKMISITVNGKKTSVRTDNKGYASVKIDLPPRSSKYTLTAQYQGVKIVNKVKVNSIIQAKNFNVKKSAKTLKFNVALRKVNGKYLKGKKITLIFNGKKYTAKTNQKGVAIIKLNQNILKKLKIGKKYSYKVIYLKDSVSKKIAVKK